MSMNQQELEGYRFEYAQQQDAMERNARTGFDPVAARLQEQAQIDKERELNTMATGQLRIEKSNGASDPTPAALPQFTINILVDGFPVKIEASGKADALFALVARLRENGATPPAWAASTVTPASATEPNEPPAPICPVHKWDMKKSQYNDDYFCGRCNAEKKKARR